MAEACWETTTPDWVFGLLVGCGVVALSAGLVWGLVLTSAGTTPQPREAPGPWWRDVRLLVCVGLVTWNLWRLGSDWDSPQDGALDVAVLLLTAGPVVLALVWVRRAVAAGVFPPARQAPFGAFWLLPALLVAAVAGGVWALALQITTARPC